MGCSCDNAIPQYPRVLIVGKLAGPDACSECARISAGSQTATSLTDAEHHGILGRRRAECRPIPSLPGAGPKTSSKCFNAGSRLSAALNSPCRISTACSRACTSRHRSGRRFVLEPENAARRIGRLILPVRHAHSPWHADTALLAT